MPTGGANALSRDRSGIGGIVISRSVLHRCLPVIKIATISGVKTNIARVITIAIRRSGGGITAITIKVSGGTSVIASGIPSWI
jgi:hypothetical protein